MFLRLVVLSSDHCTLLPVLPPLLMLLPITPPSPLLPAAPCLMSRSPWRHKMTLDFVFVAVNGVIYQKRGKATAEQSVEQLLMEPQFRLWTCVSSEGSGTGARPKPRAVTCATNSEETGIDLGCVTKTWCGAVARLAHRFFPVVTRGLTRRKKKKASKAQKAFFLIGRSTKINVRKTIDRTPPTWNTARNELFYLIFLSHGLLMLSK